MRGLPGEYTLILVDGRRQNSRESRPNGVVVMKAALFHQQMRLNV